MNRLKLVVIALFLSSPSFAGFDCSTDAFGTTHCIDGTNNTISCTTDAFGVTHCI